MTVLRSLLAKSGLVERRKCERFPAGDIHAFCWNGIEQKCLKIKDASLTGFFFLDSEQWLPGKTLSLVLQSRSFSDCVEPRQVCLQSRVVRSTADGVGVTFVPEGIEKLEWLNLIYELAELDDSHDIVQLFRVATAVVFLWRLCPSIRSELVQMLLRDIAGDRVHRVINIALKTQEELNIRNTPTRMDVPAEVILRALREGSKVDDEQIQHCWIGLLATAAEDGANDQETLQFLTILSQLIPSQVRIFTVACQRAIEVGRRSGFVFSEPLTSTIESLRIAARTSNLAVIERDLLHLNDLGIFEKAESSHSFAKIDYVDITPTQVGLKFYARCCGHSRLEENDILPLAAGRQEYLQSSVHD